MLDQDRYWDCLDQAVQASSAGRLDEALAWIDEALRANPGGAEAINNRGEILWDHGRVEDALREFNHALDLNAELLAAELNRAELLIEEFGEYEEPLETLDNLLQLQLEPVVEADVYYLKAKAYFYADDLDAALFLLRRAVQTQGELAVYMAFEGQILFELGRYEESRKRLERALVLEPETAHTVYHLALLEEHAGNPVEAEQMFQKAAGLAPELYPLPVRMELDEFEAVASEALDSLPPAIRRYVENCPVLIEEIPSRDLVQGENVSPTLLGLFAGIPATEPGAGPSGSEPRVELDRVFLFKRNLERHAHSREHLIEQIQITVKHEIGHFLGMDEEELDRLGLG